MQTATPLTSLVPVRKEPSERSEMVSQMLFGESCLVNEVLMRWVKVCLFPDRYEGWVSLNMVQLKEYTGEEFPDPSGIYRTGSFNLAVGPTGKPSFLLPPGSLLPDYVPAKQSFTHCGEVFTLGTPAFLPSGSKEKEITDTARSFLHSPYLWGGKSPLGIDCSGLVQLVFFMHNIYLPRDTGRQVEEGKTVSFLQDARPGDLAFFENDHGKVSHVGIITGPGRIIHASGMVREDRLDQEGIYTGTYTHKLRIIKRIL